MPRVFRAKIWRKVKNTLRILTHTKVRTRTCTHTRTRKAPSHPPPPPWIDWRCSHYSIQNCLFSFLPALFARNLLFLVCYATSRTARNPSIEGTQTRGVCCYVLLNQYWGLDESLRCRGFLVSTDLREPGVAGSSPCTLTTSLAIPIPSSSSSNGPSN